MTNPPRGSHLHGLMRSCKIASIFFKLFFILILRDFVIMNRVMNIKIVSYYLLTSLKV